jgi:ketosteroid isomerase-like protein
MERVDVAALNRILSDDLIYTHANGLQQTKAQLIGVLGSGDMKYESITPGDDIRVRIYNQAAVVTGRASIKIRAHGEEQTFKLCYLDVYVKQDGRWQMVAWQSSRVAP